MSDDARGPRWPTARILFVDHLIFLVIVWAVVMVLAGLVATGIAVFGTVTSSVLDQSGSILRWLALGYGTHLTYTLLPTHIAHGRTRREFFTQSTVFIVGAAVVLAGLMTLGYFLEGLVYQATGWSHTVSEDRLFSSADQSHLVFLTYTVIFTVWTTVGAFVAAAFYRSGGAGALSILPGLGLLFMAGVNVGMTGMPFLGSRPVLASQAPPLAVAMCVGSFAIAAALTWAVVRDIPLRTRTA